MLPNKVNVINETNTYLRNKYYFHYKQNFKCVHMSQIILGPPQKNPGGTV